MDVVEINPTEEEIPDSFICCVCLDLLYKPIVLPCGHISCFWCVHKSMNMSFSSKSHCPICRNPYQHFPTICQMLHFLLQKMYPLAYKRRQSQILEEENKMKIFSPQEFDGFKTHNSPAKEGSSVDSEQLKPVHSRICKQITVGDVMCAGCEQLLFRPVVLNCGHVYCESCLVHLGDEVIRCKVCQCSHPNGIPKVALALVSFLEKYFPEEYALRGDAVRLKQASFEGRIEAGNQANHQPSPTNDQQIVHFGVGCDFCGMCPIIGNRYQCTDCEESIGFDLCNDCYKTPSKLPGRFNQKHTPEHKFKLVTRTSIVFLTAISPNDYVVVNDSLYVTNYSSEDLEDALTSSSLTSGGSDENNVQNGGSTPNSSTSARRDQDDSEPAT